MKTLSVQKKVVIANNEDEAIEIANSEDWHEKEEVLWTDFESDASEYEEVNYPFNEGDDILVRKVSDVGHKEIDKAFKQLCTLYDVSDELENNGWEEDANKMRDTLNKLGTFILSTKN